jgi:transketolase
MRNAFIEELCVAAQVRKNIFLIVGDLGYSVVEPFADMFPDRFVNAGIAEQNMAGMAAGLASEGFHVFTYSIANFPTFRCAEQIRNDIDYHRLAVTTVAVGGGVAYGSLGYSHHAVQDYALMRTMPNLTLAAPGDPHEVRACVRYLLENPGPSYLRLGKAGERCFHEKLPVVKPGQWLEVSKGRPDDNGQQAVFLTTGCALSIAMDEQRLASGRGMPSVHSMPLWGLAFKQTQCSQIEMYDTIQTFEDHLVDGGFGSWLIESVNSQPEIMARIRIRGLDPLICGTVGSQHYLSKLGGLLQVDGI